MKKKSSITCTTPMVPLQQVAAAVTCTPGQLPRPAQATIALIDVDNILLAGRGHIETRRATAALAEVYAQLSGAQLSLAVVSDSAIAQLGGDPRFQLTGWTWRAAEVGPDAADHQLLDFALTALRQRPGARVAIASGDHMFAQLAEVAPIEVVVPRHHHGVARALRPYLRVRGSYRLAT